jgi:hypothetical protein
MNFLTGWGLTTAQGRSPVAWCWLGSTILKKGTVVSQQYSLQSIEWAGDCE